MGLIKIPLDGRQTDVERTEIRLEKLYLDIENPRIQYYLDARLNDNITQEQVQHALAESNDSYERLKEHIEVNGGIYNPIWVVAEGEYYKVIEGNTRALIYKELSEKYVNDEKWYSIIAYVMPSSIDRHKINFIRLEAHLFGPTPWDAYEKARELHRLATEEDYPTKRLVQLTKLTAYEIQNNIQAFMDMEEQYFPNYYKPGAQLKFSYFAEFRKNKGLKRLVREGKLSIQTFCDLVGKDKFRRGEDVRRLSMVWEDQEAREILINENMEAALDQLSQKNPAAKSKLFEKIKDVTYGLEHIEWTEWAEMKAGLYPAKVDELVKLHQILDKMLKAFGAIK